MNTQTEDEAVVKTVIDAVGKLGAIGFSKMSAHARQRVSGLINTGEGHLRFTIEPDVIVCVIVGVDGVEKQLFSFDARTSH